MKKTCLLDLPVYPEDRDVACGTTIISSTYMKERDNLKSPGELKEFVSRWRNVWLLDGDYDTLRDEEKLLVDNEIPHEAVYAQLLNKSRDDIDLDDPNVKIMMNIAIPAALLRAFMVGNKWGVGTDLAMVRLYLDPFPELNDAMRNGNGDPRPATCKKIMDE